MGFSLVVLVIVLALASAVVCFSLFGVCISWSTFAFSVGKAGNTLKQAH